MNRQGNNLTREELEEMVTVTVAVPKFALERLIGWTQALKMIEQYRPLAIKRAVKKREEGETEKPTEYNSAGEVK